MDALCLDVLNSDWHDYRGTGKSEDRLLKAAWMEQLVERWNLEVNSAPDADTLATLQTLRTLMQEIVQALLQQRVLSEKDLAALNSYLDAVPSKLHLIRTDGQLQLRQVPLSDGWQRVLGEIVASFAQLLVQYDPSRIKQCENPDCRWIYYDESWNRSRRWCEESCANLMRVRRHRGRQHSSQ